MAREQTAPAEPARLDGVEMSEDELAAELARRLDVLRRDRKPHDHKLASGPAAVPQQQPAPESSPVAERPSPTGDAADMPNDALADEISRRLESWKETRGLPKPAALLQATEQAFSRPQPRSAEILRTAHMRVERTPPTAPKSAPIAPIEVPAAARRDWTVVVPADHYQRDYYEQKIHDTEVRTKRHRIPLLVILLLVAIGVLIPSSWNPVTLYRSISAPQDAARPAAEAEIDQAPVPVQVMAPAAPTNQAATVPAQSPPMKVAPAIAPITPPSVTQEKTPAPATAATQPPIEAVVVPEKIPQAVPQDKKAPPSEKAAAPETPSPSAMKAKPFEPSGDMPTPSVTPAPDNAWLKVKPFEPSSQ